MSWLVWTGRQPTWHNKPLLAQLAKRAPQLHPQHLIVFRLTSGQTWRALRVAQRAHAADGQSSTVAASCSWLERGLYEQD